MHGLSTPPLVSCIVLCYNQARWVRSALDSVAAQDYDRLELVVTDDASTDDSQDVIAAWAHESELDVTIVSHQVNHGIVATVNEAISLTTGDYVAFLAADDIWLGGKLTRHAALLDGLPSEYAFVYSDYGRIGLDDEIICDRVIEAIYGSPPPQGQIFEACLSSTNIVHLLTVLVRRSALVEIGPGDDRLAFEDYDMVLRLAHRYLVVYSDVPSALYRVTGPSSAAQSHHDLIMEQVFELRERYIRRTGEINETLADVLSEHARYLYSIRTPHHARYLRRALKYAPSPALLWLTMCASAGIPFGTADTCGRRLRARIPRRR
jgi:glycosyltransferase involved in cell wall biosynthesis